MQKLIFYCENPQEPIPSGLYSEDKLKFIEERRKLSLLKK